MTPSPPRPVDRAHRPAASPSEAQRGLSLESLQRDVAAWHWSRFGTDCPPWAVALKLAEEAGEVCRAVVEADYASINGTGRTSDLADELVDVLVAVCGLASRSGINLTDAVDARWPVVQSRGAA